MTGPIFSHPFENDDILDQNAKVDELYKGVAEIKEMKCIEEQFRMSIQYLVHLKGKSAVLKMIQEELELDTEEEAVESVPMEIQHACKNYLPGGQDVSTWDISEVCDLIKDAERRFQKSVTNPVPPTPQRLKLPAGHLQRLIDRNQTNSQREASIISTSSPRRMQNISLNLRLRVSPPRLGNDT
jgi:hypothetical protein